LGALVHDPQANATAKAVAQAVADPSWAVVDRIPFSSARKWSAARIAQPAAAGGRPVVRDWLLGAPDVLLRPGDDAEVADTVAALSEEGRRVVLLAVAETAEPAVAGEASGASDAEDGAEAASAGRLPPPERLLSRITPAALVELSEVVRPDAADTLAYFHSQGVAVKVISGDNPVTVAAVARRVGLDVVSAVDARKLPESPDELDALVEQVTVFGRVSPAQKRTLVKALKRRGHTVAMTGDGVNDVLALKDADIGIAMGNGAQATKAVAQLVLLDSQFSHLPQVLAEGRRLIGNVERVASLFVAKNAMSAILLIAVGLFGATFPFIPLQLTLVSVFTVGLPAAVLALARNRRRYTPGFLSRVLALSLPAGAAAGVTAFLAFWLGPGPAAQRHTLALAVLLVVAFWLLGTLARPYNWWKILVVATMVGAVSLVFAVPALRDFFELALPVEGWWLIPFIGGAGAAVVEVAYRVSRRFHRVPDFESGSRRFPRSPHPRLPS
ncbi:MAG: cation-translocating P-type ATPase, partial [Propionibacteriaceae bacterium]|nr:cation-translocating P-type ATPase [Propionibacteriaceae bacterium]